MSGRIKTTLRDNLVDLLNEALQEHAEWNDCVDDRVCEWCNKAIEMRNRMSSADAVALVWKPNALDANREVVRMAKEIL